MSEKYNWIKYGNRLNDDLKSRAEPLIDHEVSKIVGKKVLVNDPRLIKLVIKWRNSKDPENEDRYLHDPAKREELKQVFNS